METSESKNSINQHLLAGSPRLSSRLQDPEQMQALLEEYTRAMRNFNARRAELQLKYQVSIGEKRDFSLVLVSKR